MSAHERFPRPARERAATAREKIQAALLALPSFSGLTLAEMAQVGGCSQTGASARWREITKDFEGVRFEISPGLFGHRLTGAPAPLQPAKAKAHARLDALEQTVREIRAAVECLQGVAGRFP